MTIAQVSVPRSNRPSRWLLLVSLALNLFFIGVGGALLLEDPWGGRGADIVTNHSVNGRIAQIVATLPREDGEKLRAGYQANRAEIDGAEANYRQIQDNVRAAVAAQPFDIDALRTAMVRMRAARQAFDRRVQDFFADIVPKLSPAGRQKLAYWRGSRRQPGAPKEQDR